MVYIVFSTHLVPEKKKKKGKETGVYQSSIEPLD